MGNYNILEHLDFLITLVLAPLATWFFSKRHFESRDLSNQDIEMLKKNLSIYQELLDDLDKRSKERIKELEDEIDTLREDIKLLRKTLEDGGK